MNYATVSNMCLWFGCREMAELASPDDGGLCPSELLRALVAGQPTGAWTAEQVETASRAVARIEDVLDSASRIAEGYLSTTHALPLDPAIIAASPLSRMVGDIARHLLHDDQDLPVVTQRRDRAVRWLEQVSRGQVNLSATTTATTGVGMPVMTSAPSIFGRSAS